MTTIYITIGLILTYIIGWYLAYTVGSKTYKDFLIKDAKDCLVENDPNNSRVQFLGIIYDENSPTYRYLLELNTGGGLILNKNILRNKLNILYTNLNEAKKDENETQENIKYLEGQIFIIETIFESADRFMMKEDTKNSGKV